MAREITHTEICRTFLLEEIETCLHVIKTGYKQRQRYLVIYEDAYQQDVGNTELLSATEIREKYNITL